MSNLHHELIGTKEASELIGESVKNTIRRVERDELKPVTKLPGLRGAYLFNRSDIEAIITSPVSTSPEADEAGDPHDARRPVPDAGAAGVTSVRRQT